MIITAFTKGIEGVVVEVHTNVEPKQLPGAVYAGLKEAQARETRIIVEAAMRSNGLNYPAGRITFALRDLTGNTPMDAGGGALDLAFALALVPGGANNLTGVGVLGGLSLSGKTQPVRGVLPCVEAMKKAGVDTVYVHPDNALEASIVEGVEVRTATTLPDLVGHFDFLASATNTTGETLGIDASALMAAGKLCPIFHGFQGPPTAKPTLMKEPCMSDVAGLTEVKEALEVAAIGGHRVLLIGPPGAGKTMLARRFAGIMPEMLKAEATEAVKIHSVAGLTSGGEILKARPFRAPHHSTTPPGLVGGGTACRPGEVSLAHNGVLFLDCVEEFSRQALEALGHVLDDGRVNLSRAQGSVSYPAKAQLICSATTCPCGRRGALPGERQCSCDPDTLKRYDARLTECCRLLKIEMVIRVPLAPKLDVYAGETSYSIQRRVTAATEKRYAMLARSIEAPTPITFEATSALAEALRTVRVNGPEASNAAGIAVSLACSTAARHDVPVEVCAVHMAAALKLAKGEALS